ncbi:MAG: chemotaxis protein CheA [Candidatus Goldbacteria bacterium]|nr:chemotaxis protein CheA [Candidatus Goldiibacteriota bacterium]
MNMDSYREVFIEEARENVNNLNNSLLELEKNLDDLTPVNELFRAAHTLKGMSATMGYDRMAGFTHILEEVLDSVRSGKTRPTLEIMNILFKSVDALSDFVDSIVETNADYSAGAAIVADSIKKQLETGQQPQFQGAPKTVQMPLKEKEEMPAINAAGFNLKPDEKIISQAAEKSMKVFLIKTVLDENCAFKNVRSFMVSRNLSEKGEIIGSYPSSRDIEDGKFESEFEFAFATALGAPETKALVSKVSEVKEVIIKEVTPEMPAENVLADKEQSASFKAEEIKNDGMQKKHSSAQSVRVNIDKLDTLMNLVGELVINKIRFDQIAKEKKYELLNDTVEEFDRVIDELQIEITSVRMLPVSHIFDRYPRSVRDLAVQAGKQVEVEIEGGDIEIDRTVLEEMNEPLLHLIRNSLAHGIEMPDVRIKAGKNPKGVIRLSAKRERNSVIIEVSDDGAGINTAAVRKKALERKVVTEERLKNMNDDEVVSLISLPGFSTVESVNKVSGRGVGVDVVKTKVEGFGGIFRIENYPKEGSKFILKLPLTLAIVQALLVKAGKEIYSIPVIHTVETFESFEKDYRYIQDRKVIILREEVIPVYSLMELLGKKRVEAEMHELVIVDVRDKKAAIEVDRVIGQQEVAIKSLGEFLKFAKGFSGVTILGDGSISLIVDITSLL